MYFTKFILRKYRRNGSCEINSQFSQFHIITRIGTYVCLCQTGFRARGDLCEDIDECAVRTHKCNANADCLNKVYDPINEGKGYIHLLGILKSLKGYLCTCHNGWMSIGTGRGPYGCVDVDECTLKLHECHSIPKSTHGFIVISSSCTNTMGSYKCACTDGWQGNGRVCENIDECRVANIDCHFNAKCVDKDGFYECECEAGYVGSGQYCLDVDECQTNQDNCDHHETCVNFPGSFRCECAEGFKGDGLNKILHN